MVLPYTYKHYRYMDYNFHTLQSVWAEANEVQGTSSECIAFSGELKIAFDIDTSGDDVTRDVLHAM